MARFISVLSGSAPSELTSTHDVRSITNGLTKRSGLIDSRSAVSTDIYADLEAAYRSGGEGTYFPPDTFVVTNGILTGSVYTASAATTQGIRTPTNYATRPTASITSTQPTLVGPSATSDSASVTYDVYLSASNAVRTVLDSITGGGPYGRLGQNPSRTLHSIWHDPNLAYFAWDDFSPGTASVGTPSISPIVEEINPSQFITFITSSTPDVTVTIPWTSEYLADQAGTATLTLTLRYVGSATTITTATPSTSATSPYGWVISPVSLFNSATGSNSSTVVGRQVEATASIFFSDAIIPAHSGQSRTGQSTITGQVAKLVTLNTRLYVSTGSTAACTAISTPIYAVYNNGGGAVVPGDNPAGSNTDDFKQLWSNLTTPTRYKPTGIPGYVDGTSFWVVQTAGASAVNGDQICEYDDLGVLIGNCSTAPCGT